MSDSQLRAEMRKVQQGDLSTLHRLVRLLQTADPIQPVDIPVPCEHHWVNASFNSSAGTQDYRQCTIYGCDRIEFRGHHGLWPEER